MINSTINKIKTSFKAKLLLIGFVYFITIHCILIEKYLTSLSPKVQLGQVIPDLTSHQFAQKKFAYLVQTERCLSELFMLAEYLSSSSECQCDVIVFSYKGKCLDNGHSHIVYLYEPNSTWNTGRNLLYTIARGRNVSYLYYIFLDGDIYFKYNETIAPDTMMTKSPMRSFEQFLIKREPGIGVTDYRHHHGANFIIPRVHNNCNVNANTDLSNRTSIDSLFLTSVHFDAAFNAFHREIVDEILPYSLDYEINWHLSQLLLVTLFELKFRGQAILFRPVIAYNPMHSRYPKGGDPRRIIWPKIAKKIVFTMPKRYQDNDWVKQLSKNPSTHIENSLTMCFISPIQDSFKMYSHFELNWSV